MKKPLDYAPQFLSINRKQTVNLSRLFFRNKYLTYLYLNRSMASHASEFLNILTNRGFIHQCTDAAALDATMKNGRIAAYVGFDCTAPSLHVGSLIPIMVLRWLQKSGHKPIVVLGGGTTQVGDPSGKDESRKLLSDEDIERNLESIKQLLSRFLTFGNGPTDAIMVNNSEWLAGLNYIQFLREIGKHFSVNRMLTQDSVKMRLEREQNLSFLEFNYMVLQAYDFAELHKRYACRLQIGGSDQWGNIVMGIELDRRLTAGREFQPLRLPENSTSMQVLEVQPMIRSTGHPISDYSSEHFMSRIQDNTDTRLFGLTTPLLATASGAKMGKTASGAIWLSADQLPPYDYWQFWRNVEDADVERFLKLFTELPLEEVSRLAAMKGADINEAKKILATEATRLAHGDKAARLAAETARKAFEEGATAEGLPEIEITAVQLGKGLPTYEIFRLSGLADSGGEAKRLIRGGGAKVNDIKVADEQRLITPTDFAQGPLKLSAGKKRLALVKLT